MTASSLDVSVIIPTFRRYAPLISTVKDLLQQKDCRFQITVVDQNVAWPSDYDEQMQSLSNDPRLHWIKGFPRGVVHARNFAAAVSGGRILVFVDDDVEISDPLFLSRHLKLYEDSTIAAVAGAELYRSSEALAVFLQQGISQVSRAQEVSWEDRPLLDQVLMFPRDSTVPARVCSFCTCNASIRRDVFTAVGGFDEAFTGNAYGDDYDLAIRVRSAGHTILYSPEPWLVHLQLPMGGLRLSDRQNSATELERAMSPVLFFVRYADRRWAWHLLYRHVLRKTVFRRDNIVRVWRQPIAWWSLVLAFSRVLRQGRWRAVCGDKVGR